MSVIAKAITSVTMWRGALARLVLVLVACGFFSRSTSADEPAPEAKPVVLPSRSFVERMYWVGEGKTLVFGGNLQASEPGWSVEARRFDENRTIRLPGVGDANLFAASSDGATFILAEKVADTTVEFRIIDLKKREKLKTLSVDIKDRLFNGYAIAFSPDGTMLACAGFVATPTIEKNSDNLQSKLLLLDLRTGKVHADLVQKDDIINTVAFSPDGKLLVTGHNVIDKEKPGVKVWDVGRGTLVKEWPANRMYVTGVAVSPDGKHVASVGYSSKLPKDGDDFKGWEWDNHVTIHDIKTGELVTTLKGHTRSPVCVAFSKDGLLASGGADKTVKIWKVGSEESLHTFTGHTAQLRALAFAPDGKRLASGGLEKSVYIWDMISVKKAGK